MGIFATGIDEHELPLDVNQPPKCSELAAYLVLLKFAVIVRVMYDESIGAVGQHVNVESEEPILDRLTRTPPLVHRLAFQLPPWHSCIQTQHSGHPLA